MFDVTVNLSERQKEYLPVVEKIREAWWASATSNRNEISLQTMTYTQYVNTLTEESTTVAAMTLYDWSKFLLIRALDDMLQDYQLTHRVCDELAEGITVMEALRVVAERRMRDWE